MEQSSLSLGIGRTMDLDKDHKHIKREQIRNNIMTAMVMILLIANIVVYFS